jgi:DNA-binding protein HU-beta
MNSKDLQLKLSKRLSLSNKETSELLGMYVEEIRESLHDGNNELSFLNLGVFEVKQKEQRIMINPATRKRMLIPPKLVLNFKPSVATKNKFKK